MAIAAPAEPMYGRRIRKVQAWCQARGFRVRISPDVKRARTFTRQDDEFRACNLMELASDPKVRAIICARGGYGTARVLRFLDSEPFRRNAPLLMGYSDATLLLAWASTVAGLVTFHGPVAWSLEPGMNGETEASLVRALTASEPWGPVGRGYTEVVVPGRASGQLVGGNLTMVAHTLGTPYEVQTEGTILFLEDTSGYEDTEEDIEQALLHLKMAGSLDRAAGFVLGELSDDEDYAESLLETFLDLVGRDRPVLAGFPAGHVEPNLVLPFGVRVELNGSGIAGLRVLESPLDPAEPPARVAIR